MTYKITFIISCLIMLLTGCSATPFSKSSDGKVNCKAEIDYADYIKFNDIGYFSQEHLKENDASKLKTGKQIGEVSFSINERACEDYRPKNGDATFLPIGTPIYEIQGYKPSFRIIANGKLFQVVESPKAKKVVDMYDIKDRVTKITIVRDTDHDERVIDAKYVGGITSLYLDHPIIGEANIYKKGVPTTVFLRFYLTFHLNDGTTIGTMYKTESEILSPGIIVNPELSKILHDIIKQEFNL